MIHCLQVVGEKQIIAVEEADGRTPCESNATISRCGDSTPWFLYDAYAWIDDAPS
jgi:hypothetical protein